ncbi:MAG: amidohydrolase [Alistipes sp.]|nr:amidohydrolase [Alistipes sp.]
MKTLITNAIVVPMTTAEEHWFTGSVGIEDGKIAFVANDDRPEELKRVQRFKDEAGTNLNEIDGRGKLVMPGLVNTHTHVSMTLLRNLADDLPLMTWLTERVWPFEAHMGAEEVAVGARLGMAEMLLGGTTTLVDMYWHEAAVARAARETGIRAVLCPSFVDGPRMEEFERDLVETLAEAEGCDRLSVRIAPHAAYTCSAENLRRAVELARRHNIGIHTHVSETTDEQRIVSEQYGCTPTEYLRDAGLFDVPAMAAHCVWLSESDMDIMLSHGVAVVHNPQSNMKLASGAAPIAKMLARGLTVSIGTDGASSNNDLDMWDEMRSASFLGKLTALNTSVLPAYEILRMATVNGARAIGMEGSLGVVAEGALADLVILDVEKPHWSPRANIVSALVYSAKASDVDTVIVGGEVVVSGGRLVTGDVGVFISAAEAVQLKISCALKH